MAFHATEADVCEQTRAIHRKMLAQIKILLKRCADTTGRVHELIRIDAKITRHKNKNLGLTF